MSMNPAVEKVARASYEGRSYEPATKGEMWAWETLKPETRDYFRREARTAMLAHIDAMMEPSEAVLCNAIEAFRTRFGGNDELTDVVGSDDLKFVLRCVLLTYRAALETDNGD